MPIKRLLRWAAPDGLPLDIGVEFDPGDVRFTNPLKDTGYGHIRRHMGEDGDALDIYVGPDLSSQKIFRIDQVRPDGSFDESKYCLGFTDAAQASAAYLNNVPANLFGGIALADIEEIRSKERALCAAAIEKVGYATIEDVGGRARVVISRATPAYGEKCSENDRCYVEEPVWERVEIVKQRLSQGERIVNHLGHGKPIYKVVTENGERINKFSHFDHSATPEISALTSIEKSSAGEVIIRDEFTYSTPESILWSERAARREYLPRSWEVLSWCDRPGGHGNCSVTDFYEVVWLDPAIDRPGFGPTARMIEVVESVGYLRCTDCDDNNPCDKCKKNNSQPQSIPISEMSEAGEPSSSGQTTKGARTKMSTNPKTPTPNKEAAGGMTFNVTAEDWLKMVAGKPWSEVKTMIPGDLDANVVAGMWADAYGDGMGSAPGEATATDLQLSKPKTAKTGQMILPDQSAPFESAKPNEEAAKKTEKPDPKEEEFARERQAFLAERAEAKDRATRIAKVREFATSESFHGLNLTDQKLYPVSNVKVIVEDVVSLIEKNDPLVSNLDKTETYLFSELKNLGIRSKAIIEQDEKAKLQGTFAGTAVAESGEVKETFETMYKRADEAALRTPQGAERLRIRDGIKEDVNKKWGKQMNLYREKHGRAMAEAVKTIRAGKDARNFVELKEAAVISGLIPATESVMTGTNLANQALAGDVIYRRMFEEDESNRIFGELGNDLLAGVGADPLNQFGDELRWATHYFVEPSSDNDGIIDNPDSDAVTVVNIERGYDSAFAEEMAYEYQWAIKALRNLENGPYRERIFGEMVDSMGAFFGRRLAKQKWTEADNICRRDGFYNRLDGGATKFEDTDEDGANTEMDAGPVVTFQNTLPDGTVIEYDVTYGANVDWVYRLKMNQATTGQEVEPRLIIRPTVDKFLNRSGLSSQTFNVFSGTENDGTTALVFGEFDENRNVVDKFAGQNATCAVDYENCAIAFKTGTTDIDGTHPPKNLRYSWCDLVDVGGNLSIFSLTVPDTKTPEEHYNSLLQMIVAKSAYTQENEFVTPRLAVTSSFIARGVVTAAQRWQANFDTVGSNLKANFQDVNEVGQVGAVTIFGTNGKLPGKSGVLFITNPGYSKWAITEALNTDGIRPLDTSSSAGNPTNSTTSQRQKWRLQRAIKSPQVYNKSTGVAYNRMGSVIKLIGETSFF